jgi:hypothetical protein
MRPDGCSELCTVEAKSASHRTVWMLRDIADLGSTWGTVLVSMGFGAAWHRREIPGPYPRETPDGTWRSGRALVRVLSGIHLSRRIFPLVASASDEWEAFVAATPVGTIVSGAVLSHHPFGARIERARVLEITRPETIKPG